MSPLVLCASEQRLAALHPPHCMSRVTVSRLPPVQLCGRSTDTWDFLTKFICCLRDDYFCPYRVFIKLSLLTHRPQDVLASRHNRQLAETRSKWECLPHKIRSEPKMESFVKSVRSSRPHLRQYSERAELLQQQ
jgi:hypothetical protein